MRAAEHLPRISLLRTAWASARHRRVILVGRGSVFRVRTLDMPAGGRLTVGLVHGQAGARVDVRGTLRIGGQVQIMRGCRVMVRSGAVLDLGHRTYLNDNTTIVVHERVSIGEGCAVAWGCTITDADGHRLIRGDVEQPRSAPVVLDDWCWLGAGVTVLKGVTLGQGCVVGAGSVVCGSSGDRVLLAGVPARPVDKGVEWVR